MKKYGYLVLCGMCMFALIAMVFMAYTEGVKAYSATEYKKDFIAEFDGIKFYADKMGGFYYVD